MDEQEVQGPVQPKGALAKARRWASTHAQDLVFTAALLAIAVGLWWERPSLALILPGGLVVVLMIYSRLAGGPRKGPG